MSITQEPITSPDEPRRSNGAADLDPTQPDRGEGTPPQVSDRGTNANNEGTTPISAKQQAANQRNAQKSTGPRTKDGKARSSLNAVRHGIYGRPNAIRRGELAEDKKEVTEFIEALMDDLDPRDAQEFVVARRIAEGELRLARADRFESAGLSAAGRLTAYDRKSGLGQEQEESSEILIERFLDATQLLQGAEADTNDRDWYQALDVLFTIKGVPPERRDYPEGWKNQGWDSVIWKRFVLDKLVPRYWPSLAAAADALGAWVRTRQ